MLDKKINRVAFYAFTNLCLINASNVRVTYYPKSEAVLFLRVTKNISHELVDSIRKSKIFDNIVMIPYPVLDNKVGALGKIPKIRMLTYGYRMQKFHDYYFESSKVDMFFDVAVVPYFCNYTIYYLSHWQSINNQIRIEFYEEGLSTFSLVFGTYKGKTSPHVLGHEKKIHKLLERIKTPKLRRHATKTVYVYNEKMLLDDVEWDARTLSALNNNQKINSIMKSVAECEELRCIKYSKARVYYIANYLLNGLEQNYSMSYEIINTITNVFRPNDLIIKTHASNEKHRNEYAKQYENQCFVDRGEFFVESVYANIEDIDFHLFVSRASSLVFNIFNWFKVQPFVIFTYKMFPYFSQTGDPDAEHVVQKLRELYDDPSRIMTPHTFLELEMMLDNCKRRIYGLPLE